jgi:hypothetical protein
MAKYSNKVKGKEIGEAKVYAEPHTMTGGKVTADAKSIQVRKDPNTLSAKETGPRSVAMRVSAGDPGNDYVKTDGIEMRGAGTATKGRMSRGPMA